MTRSGVEIEVWFTDISARVVKARWTDPDGSVKNIDIVHNRDRRGALDELVTGWIDAPTRHAAVMARTRQPGSIVSAAHSGEFEAIGKSWATRPAPRSTPAAITRGRRDGFAPTPAPSDPHRDF